MPLYHHCMDLERVVFGEIVANPEYSDDPDLKPAYLWLEKQVGFYPLFLSVGNKRNDILITGYDRQWKRLIVVSSKGNQYRKKREFPNLVLFSFEEIEGVFTDYEYWHCVLGGDNTANNSETKRILKRSWSKARWLRKARNDDGSVQLVTNRIYLPDAKRVWVRNKETKEKLEDMGFSNVKIKRVPVI